MGKSTKRSSPKPAAVHIEMTQIVVGGAAKKKYIRLNVDGQTVNVWVSEGLYADWKNQFLDKRRTQDQRNRFFTLMKLVEAAYRQGLKDAQKAKAKN